MDNVIDDKPILKLDEELIGKIAAGEVVENPASAVKELVENSLDAGANCVTVELRDGGISYLRVTDNGHGIRSQDIRLAFERHATSKIRQTDDLFDLHTLGFRGEALASIAAVTKLTLTTHYIREEMGIRATCEGGLIHAIEPIASAQGTTIVARDLFYNTPVRRKFLKKPVTEASKVADVVARLILSRPDVSFRLINNGKQLYMSSGNSDLRGSVFALYGREIAQEMHAVIAEGSISVKGLVGVGQLARANRARQTFVVNGRVVRSPILTQALEDACRERFTVGHYPICVLNIDMPTGSVDVNVHPNKLEVRFSDEHLVFESVRGAVADSLSLSPLSDSPQITLVKQDDEEARKQEKAIVTIIDTTTEQGISKAREAICRSQAEQEFMSTQQKKEQQVTSIEKEGKKQVSAENSLLFEHSKIEKSANDATQLTSFKSFVTQFYGGKALRESVIAGKAPENFGFKPLESSSSFFRATGAELQDAQEQSGNNYQTNGYDIKPSEQQSVLQKQNARDALSGYSVVGVAFDTYIILQNSKQLLFIDQHAAHERILYERLMREVDTTGCISQQLLTPILVRVTPQDVAKIEEYAQDIRAAGYDAQPFGDNTYQLRAVPNILGEPQGKAAFLEMVDRLGELRVLATQKKRRDAILQMACKKAVKSGDKLTIEEIQSLLSDILTAASPPTCPHGRSFIVTLTRTELEKRFKRINN